MRIRIAATISGTRNGQDWPPIGTEMDVPDIEGAELCRTGLAQPVATQPEPERAVSTKPAEKRK